MLIWSLDNLNHYSTNTKRKTILIIWTNTEISDSLFFRGVCIFRPIPVHIPKLIKV